MAGSGPGDDHQGRRLCQASEHHRAAMAGAVAALLLAICSACAGPAPPRSTPAARPAKPQIEPAPVEPPASATAAAPLGFRGYLIGSERSAITTDGLSCTHAAATPWKEVCIGTYTAASPGKITIGGAWINDFVLTFINGKLAGIETMFESRYFSRVVYSIAAQLGQPAKEQEVISGGYGIKVSADKAVWDTAGGLVIVREMAGTPSYSSARFYSPGMARSIRR